MRPPASAFAPVPIRAFVHLLAGADNVERRFSRLRARLRARLDIDKIPESKGLEFFQHAATR